MRVIPFFLFGRRNPDGGRRVNGHARTYETTVENSPVIGRRKLELNRGIGFADIGRKNRPSPDEMKESSVPAYEITTLDGDAQILLG